MRRPETMPVITTKASWAFLFTTTTRTTTRRTRITVPTRFLRAQSIYGTYDIYRRSPLSRGHGLSDSVVLQFLFQRMQRLRRFREIRIEVERAAEVFRGLPVVAARHPDVGTTFHCAELVGIQGDGAFIIGQRPVFVAERRIGIAAAVPGFRRIRVQIQYPIWLLHRATR